MTCEDKQYAKFFDQRSEHSHVDIETFPETSEVTFEFWTKSNRPYSQSGTLLSMFNIDEDEKEGDVFMAIRV